MKDEMPKYQLIKHDIRDAIKRGDYRSGDKIPSESQLGAKYQASRITVVRAINDLAQEGLLRREHGRGSFVNQQIQETVAQLTGFHERMQKLQLPLVTKVLKREKRMIPLPMVEQFHLDKTTETIFIKRLRIVDGVPLCISYAYFIAAGNEWLMEEDIERKSVYDLLEHTYCQSLGKGVQRFSVGCLHQDAKLLSMGEQDALLKLTLFTQLQDGTPFEYDTTYYNPDLYAYEQQLTRR